MNNLYNEDYISALFTFDNGRSYEISMDDRDSSNKFILKISKSELESEKDNTPFGSIIYNSVRLECVDISGDIDPNNFDSPYFSYMRNGVKIELTKHSYDNMQSKPYGTFYVTNWSSVVSDGTYDKVIIEARDELNYIVQRDMPKLPAYSGIEAGDLILDVLVRCGVDASRIKISNELNYKLVFGTTEDTKVGYFLNEICYALCACIVIDSKNNILVMPALKSYGTRWDLNGDGFLNMSNNNNNKNIYSKVKIMYDRKIGDSHGVLLNTDIDLKAGDNVINSLLFNGKAINVSEVAVEKENKSISIKDFNAYQNGIDLVINSNETIEGVSLQILGKAITTVRSYATSNINYTDQKNDRVVSLEIYNKYISTEEDAQEIANNLSDYIEMHNRYIMIDSIYTPDIECGDMLVFNNEYIRGKYKVVETYTNFGMNYIKKFKLIALNNSLFWDDALFWDDNIQWVDNFELSIEE